MDYLPLFTRLKDRRCVVVGGGDIALRKARLLAGAGARVFVIAPQVQEALSAIATTSGGAVELRESAGGPEAKVQQNQRDLHGEKD